MTILLQIDIFSSILKKLPFIDLIIFRRVCYQWKKWIDNYLKQQKILLITEKEKNKYKRFTAVTQTLNLNYNQIVSAKLEINSSSLNRKGNNTIASSLLRIFPNVEELYIVVEQRLEYSVNMDCESLLFGWKGSLKKLIIPGLDHYQLVEIVECLSYWKKLETFGMFEHRPEERLYYNLRYIESIDFFLQFISLWVPRYDWLYHQECYPKIAGVVGADHSYLPKNKFPNIKKIFAKVCFSPGERNISLCEELKGIAELGHENLYCLKIEIRCSEMISEDSWCPDSFFWSNEKFDEARYPPFFNELNRLPGVKTVKFEFDHPVCLEYILRNCANFEHVETLIINYKYFFDENFDEPELKLCLPANFLKLLPKSVNRIQNMEFHLEPQIGDGFKKTDFSEFSHKVMIFHDL